MSTFSLLERYLEINLNCDIHAYTYAFMRPFDYHKKTHVDQRVTQKDWNPVEKWFGVKSLNHTMTSAPQLFLFPFAIISIIIVVVLWLEVVISYWKEFSWNIVFLLVTIIILSQFNLLSCLMGIKVLKYEHQLFYFLQLHEYQSYHTRKENILA